MNDAHIRFERSTEVKVKSADLVEKVNISHFAMTCAQWTLIHAMFCFTLLYRLF